jgi:hypothetical protein
MVTKFLVSLATAALVMTTVTALHPPPAGAAAAATVVTSHNLNVAGLRQFRDQCSAINPNPAQAAPLSLRSGSVGTHSIGWQFAIPDYEVGALAPVFHPASLSTVLLDVYSPTAHARGHAVAFYYDNTPGFTAGYWVGFRSLTQNASGWSTLSTGSLTLFWEYYEGNTLLAWYDDPWTIAQLAGFRGGDGRGAYVGVALGCDQEAFYVDNLRTADAFDQKTYDFEGVPSGSGLGWLGINKKGKKEVYFRDVSVWYGMPIKLLGLGWDQPATAIYPGTGSFYAKSRGDSSFRRVHGEGFDPAHFADFKTTPKEQTTYLFTSDGTDVYEATNGSNAVNVFVLARLNARINDLSLKPGQRAVLSGRIGPGDRGTKVTLERRVGNRWTSAATTRTGGGGAFSVSTKATKVGKMVLRLKVAPPRRGIAGAVSTWVTVTVTPRPKPNPPNPGGGGGGSSPYTTHTETTTTASTGTPPSPDDENIRVLTKLPGQPKPLPTTSEPICTLPGPYLAPCPPARRR